MFADAFELDRAAILALVPPDEPSGEYDGTPDDDYISGDGGDNLLRGFAGYDVLEGNGGDDRLEGGEDNDELYGGDGAFVFSYEFGHDRIEDFSLTEDVVEVWGAVDFEQLMFGAVQVGNDVTIDLGWDGSITLANIDIEDLTAAHFTFGQPQMFSARGNGEEAGDDGLMDTMFGEAVAIPEIDDLLGWSGGGGLGPDFGLVTNSSARVVIGSLMDELRDRSFSVPHHQDYCFA